ncbi:MAG: hypothetical protein CSA70_10000 [Rhodobacterales bacterium]|nr:MAG: hypothetical protein CSA70_10000 [Rhodobacterales bacterium]
MADLVLDWGLFGAYGTAFGSSQSIDTGGVQVTVGFVDEDEGAQAVTYNADGYVAEGEPFDPKSHLKLFGEGGEGGVDDTSTTTIDFSSSDEMFGDEVQNVSFRLNDVDAGGQGEPSLDIITIRAYDANGNLVPVTVTPGGMVNTSGTQMSGGGDDYDATDPSASALVQIAGPLSRIEIDYDNGQLYEQRVLVSDIHFSTVDVHDEIPDANDDTDTTLEGVAVDVDVLGNDSDPNGDPLTVTIATGPSNGTATVNPDGTVHYVPDAGFTGTDTLQYTITDPDGNTDTATVTITVRPDHGGNNAPVAADDTDTTLEGVAVDVDVLGNDSDPDGDPLTVTIASGPANGTATVNPDGTINYVPDAGFTGTDTVEYTITDPDGATDTATVTITVEPNNPTRDGYVDGTGGDDLIDPGYTGDPDGDYIDNNDAILPGEGPNDDIVRADEGNDTVYAGEGDDEILGGGGNDELHGEADNDSIIGEEGNDILDGGDGDDTLRGGDGNDTATGGEGDDVIDTSGSRPAIDVVTLPGVPVDANPGDDLDSVDGGAGNDVIETGDDRDTVDGGTGDDTINAGIDDDIVRGGDGNDYIIDPQGADNVDGGDGDDTILVGLDTFSDYTGDDRNLPIGSIVTDPNTTDGMDTVHGGAGNDSIMTGDDADWIDGGTGADTIVSGIDDDTVIAGDGDDSVIGGHGSDSITGNAGDDYIDASAETSGYLFPNEPDATDPIPENDMDTVFGGTGNDTIITGDDDDSVDGGTGNDMIDGGIDDDILRGRAGDDSITGGLGADTVTGGLGEDVIYGDNEGEVYLTDDVDPDPDDNRDLLDGRQDNDTIYGGDDDDTLLGGLGDDYLDGGIDEDSIEGGSGDDTIVGGQGADSIYGQGGRDSIVGGNGGDFVHGGSSPTGIAPDGRPFDYDTLDLSGSTPAGGRIDITYTSADREDGHVDFFDADGNDLGRLEFRDIENVIPCFTPGTAIATPKGERLVEELKVGDKIITRDNGIQEIQWMGTRALTGHDLARAPHLRPVLIQKGSLGNNLPEHDILVSPQHRMLLNNEKTALYFEDREVLAAAKHLTDMPGVDEVGTLGVTYVHFMFERHEVVLSNGVWSESFQPGQSVMDGMGEEQRNEIFELFPELKTREGLDDYAAARRSLKKHEARLLVR